MRFHTKERLFHCGIDPHTRSMHTRSMCVCILDQHCEILLHRNLPTDPDAFLSAIKP